MDRYIGQLLDNRYEILEIIGSGGMAVVYKARCHRLNRLVAIKILKDENLEDEDFCRRFHAESQAVAMLSHPNIVSVYDVSSTEEQDYIVMELIDGITLKQYMEKKGVLSWRETVHFATLIARALDHAHGKGLVHRDIKPHNVMVLKNGSVKVADFGIARMMESNNTMTKEALGSVHYISPEQAKGGRVDNRSDLYSLGVVMYEMITGRTPYDGESPVAVAIQHINGGAPRPSTINPNIPKGLEQIIMKAMAHDLQDRYISATALLEDLDAFRSDPTMTFHTVELPLIPEQRPELRVHPASISSDAEGNASKGNRPMRQEADWETSRKPVQNQEDPYDSEGSKKDKTATLAVIFCSVAAIVAIIIFMILLTEEDLFSTDNAPGGVVTMEQTKTTAYPLQSSKTPGETEAVNVALTPRQEEEQDFQPKQVEMQNLVNLSRQQAEQILNAQGFTDVQWVEQLQMCPAGTVIGQSIAPGQTVAVTQKLRITCAAGAVTMDCTFYLPFRTESFYLSIFLDGRPVVTDQKMEAYHATATFQLCGRGVQTCQVYIDGNLYQTLTVNFDAAK